MKDTHWERVFCVFLLLSPPLLQQLQQWGSQVLQQQWEWRWEMPSSTVFLRGLQQWGRRDEYQSGSSVHLQRDGLTTVDWGTVGCNRSITWEDISPFDLVSTGVGGRSILTVVSFFLLSSSSFHFFSSSSFSFILIFFSSSISSFVLTTTSSVWHSMEKWGVRKGEMKSVWLARSSFITCNDKYWKLRKRLNQIHWECLLHIMTTKHVITDECFYCEMEEVDILQLLDLTFFLLCISHLWYSISLLLEKRKSQLK